MDVIYVIGVPGSGKTTMVTRALGLLDSEAFIPADAPVPHVRYGDVWHLGPHKAPFGGTDALSMSIQPRVVAWLADLHRPYGPVAAGRGPRILIGEGDRLANTSFFTAVTDLGHRLTVLHLDLRPLDARTRAFDRAALLGLPNQSAAWFKGRVTKTRNLVDSRPVTRFDATLPADTLARNLHHLLTTRGRHPTAQPANQ